MTDIIYIGTEPVAEQVPCLDCGETLVSVHADEPYCADCAEMFSYL